MEFYNVKLLPKGLPEIIAQFVPYEYYPDTKVIAYPRKAKGGHLGQLCYGPQIRLYPTMIAFHSHGVGTYSFQLWHHFLKVALHEVGHLATIPLCEGISEGDYEFCWEAHCYVEDLADRWCDQAMARILQVDPRLGQPSGRLTGYPGILAYQRRAGSFKQLDKGRIEEWRAMSCDAQVPLHDIVHCVNHWEPPSDAGILSFLLNSKLTPEQEVELELRNQKRQKSYHQSISKTRRLVHKAASILGITRCYVNRQGKRYLMFNVGEAEAVYKHCLLMGISQEGITEANTVSAENPQFLHDERIVPLKGNSDA